MTRSRSLEKQENITKAASSIFLKMGYTNASMDLIAQVAGVSKQTIYSHFGSKEALFLSILQDKCECRSQILDEGIAQNRPVQDVLYDLGYSFIDFLSKPENTALLRLVMGEGAHNKKLAEMFWENGPAKTTQLLADFLEKQIQLGHIKGSHPEVMAEHFLHMVTGHIHLRLMLNLQKKPSEAEKQRHVNSAVAAFMQAYAL